MIANDEGLWAGVDWGTSDHAVHAVSAGSGEVCVTFRVGHTPEGLQDAVARLQAAGRVLGVAVETSRHLLVAALIQAGLPVYAINPKQSHAWRKAWAVSEAKDDRRDAKVLARGLREHHTRLFPLEPADAATRELALLCEDEQDLIGERTALVQRLRATLQQYHPEALTWFVDWTSPTAWDFVAAFPTPQALAEATVKKLVGFLRTHHVGLRPCWQARVQARGRALTWPQDPPVIAAKALRAVAIAKQLRTIEAQLRVYRTRIRAAFAAHASCGRYSSVPGAGPKLGPRLAAIIESAPAAQAVAEALQPVTGTAPVTFQSGGRKIVRMRRACRKSARTTLHLFAWQAVLHGGWSRVFYDRARARGQDQALALRNLANKWIKILCAMRRSGEAYDEGRYQEQLRKHGSPLTAHLPLPAGGG